MFHADSTETAQIRLDTQLGANLYKEWDFAYYIKNWVRPQKTEQTKKYG